MVSKLVERFKLIFSGSFCDYKFSLKDRFLGSRIVLSGYPSIQEKKLENYSRANNFVENNFDHLKIKDFDFYVTQNTFKPGELAYLHNETFVTVKDNPHSYETDFIKINKDDVVIDAGACEGFFTKYALDRGACKVYAFEPFENFKVGLEKTFNKEIEKGVVSVVPQALSGVCGIAKFNIDAEYLCAAQLSDNGSVDVETITMDFFVEQRKLKKLDFIKMDIEGAEVDVIRNASSTIKRFKPKMSIAVYHKHENAKLIKDIILNICPEYKVKFGGCFMHERPFRPYMLYAYL